MTLSGRLVEIKCPYNNRKSLRGLKARYIRRQSAKCRNVVRDLFRRGGENVPSTPVYERQNTRSAYLGEAAQILLHFHSVVGNPMKMQDVAKAGHLAASGSLRTAGPAALVLG